MSGFRRSRGIPLAIAFALAIAIGGGAASAADSPPPRLREVSEAWGLGFLHHSGGSGRRYMMETNSGGVVLFDYDNDGDNDVLFIDAGPLPGYTGEPGRSVLFRNDGAGTFRDVTDHARLTAPGYNNGATAGDIDGDGDLDLYVTAYGANQLFLNNGDGTFRDATTQFGVAGDRWTSSAAFADFDRDGLLDLYAVSYLDYPIADAPTCKSPKGIVGFCHPAVFTGDFDQYFRNVDGRRFEDATGPAGLAQANGKGLGLVAADFDDDGWTDLYVANDTTPNFFFRNLGDGTFEDVSLFSGTSFGDRMTAEAGMGVTFGDIDGDGLFDLFVTNFDLETNALYRNIGGGLFTDMRHVFGIAQPSLTRLGFGTDFCDIDHDGDLDLLIANGHILDNVELSFPGISYEQKNQLLLNLGDGRFLECDDCGLDVVRVSRGLATGDLDGDGDLEVVVVDSDALAEVYENITPSSPNWLLIDLLGAGTNTFGIGTRIEVRAEGRRQVTEAVTATSYLSQKPLTRHFGLAAATRVERVDLRWPGGQRQAFTGLPTGRRLRLVQTAAGGR